MAVGRVEVLHGVEQLMLGFSGEAGGQILQLRAVVHIVLQHIGEDGENLSVPLAGGVGVDVAVGVLVIVGMVVGMGMLHTVVGVGMGVFMAVFQGAHSDLILT